ncbi:hypothetical protein PDUR_23660 [Paenibacillus durus]|uniref:Uncharacterized protein n=1 Tax=Paenibacillus durus TaxID=44251 RepID=A0A089J034_PAEDU|nr:hypothetical protein PDUR_23660 [Paenibacillus durus]
MYKKTTLSEQDFFTLNYVNLKELEFTGDQVQFVEVYTKSDEAWYTTNQQGTFIVLDKDRLVLLIGGVYFNLKRI